MRKKVKSIVVKLKNISYEIKLIDNLILNISLCFIILVKSNYNKESKSGLIF